MQKPARAAKSFDLLIDTMLKAQGIAGKTDLAIRLKSPDKAIHNHAKKVSESIAKAKTQLDTIAGEAISPEANVKIKQNIEKAEKAYVKQVAESQKRAQQKLNKLVEKAKRGPEVDRIGAVESAKGAFDREVGQGIETAKRALEREKERILDVPIKLKPSVAADEVLKKWKSAIRVLVTEFGQGGGLAAREFQEMYASTAGGFKFDQSLYGVASKTKTLLGQTGKFFREMGSRSGDVLPLNEYEDLIKKMKEFRRVGGLSSTAVNPIIELSNVVANATNVFDKMKLAVKASAPPETIAAIQKEIDQFIELRQISKDSTAQLSIQAKETRGLGFSMDKFGYAIDLLIQYLEKAIIKFQGLGKTAHTALGSIKSGMKGQTGLFKAGLSEMEGPVFKLKPEGFKMAEPLNAMFAEMYSASFNSLQELRKVTDKGLSAWSASFKGGLSKTDRVVKQNSSKLIGGLSKLKRQIFQVSDVDYINWDKLLNAEGAAVLRKSAAAAGMQIKELQSDLAKFKTGKIKEVKAFPAIKTLQTQLKTVLAISDEVQRKIASGEVGMEHFPAVDRLQQYALQLTGAIDMIEKPYKTMAGLAGKEDKISSKQLGKSFRAGITGAQKELESAIKEVKAPMKSVMTRLFEDVLTMTPAEIPQAANMMRSLASQFPSQMQSAFNAMGKKKYDLGKFISKMFKIDPGDFATVEDAIAKHGAEIPEMLLRAIFPTEGQAQFAVKAKKMANQIITAPLNKALKSAGDVTMPKFEVFRIGEEMMRNAKFDGEKFTQVKSQYGTHISGLIKEIDRLMKTSPSKKMKPILEKIFSPTDVNDINAYATGMKGALSNIKDYLQKATAGKLSKEQLAAGMGLQEELKTAGLEVDENELAQMFEKMYNRAGQSLRDFVSQEKKWSAESITDLMKLMEYWENLGGMVDMVTKKLPKVSGMKTVADVMFKDKDVGAIKAGQDMARLMVKSLESTLSEGGKIKTPLAAMIGRSPEVIFEIMRGTNQKLKNELKDMGFNLRGSTRNMIKSINELSEAKITTEWFERYREANERFYLEGKKTEVTLDSIRRGFATITPLSTAGLSELATRSQDFLNRAGISFESFSANLFKHSVNFDAFSDKQKATIGKYTNILSKGMRTIGQFMQEDPFSGSIMRLVRNEDVLWEKLIAAADKGGSKLKMSIQSELAQALDVSKREGINLDRLFKGAGKVPGLQEIIGQLKEVKRIKQAVDKEMIAPGTRPFSTLIKDASTLQGTMLSALGSISQGLSRVGKTGKVDIEMKDSVRDLDTITQHLNVLQAEIDETIVHAKNVGKKLPLEFQLVARSVAEMGSSLNSSYNVLKKLPTHANVSEAEMEKLTETVNKSTSALKKFDQIDLKEFNQKLGVAMSTAMNKVNAFSKSAGIRPSFQLGKTGIDKIMRAEGADSEKMIQQWREAANAGGDTWKQMTMFLKGLEPEMKGIFERFASKPRLLLKAFSKMTPQMRVLMSLYFNEMGHATADGFNKWMTTYDKYFSGMTKTNKRHLAEFLGNTSKTMAAFKAPDVTKFFPPETGMETDKTTEGLKRLGNAMAKLGINMNELKKLSGDTTWLTKWGETFAKTIAWDFGPGKGKEIQLTGTFSMFGNAITLVGEGLDVLVTQLNRVGKEAESGSIKKGITELVNLISKLDSGLSKTSKYKLSLGAGLGQSLKPLRDVGYAINSFFDAMTKMKSASDFSLTQKEITTFGRVIVVTMAQIATVIKPAIESLGKFASNETVKRFSRFAQGLKDLVLATKDLYQLTAVFSEVEKDSKSSATALGHFEKVIASMIVLLDKMPNISRKLSIINISNDQINNAKRLTDVLRPLAQSLLLIGEAFKKGVNADANMKKFAASLKGMVDVIRSIDLDPVTKDLLNDVRKLTQIFSSKALIAVPDEAEQRLEMLAKVVEQGTNKVAQKTKQGLQKVQQAAKPKSKQDFLSDLGITSGVAGGAAADITTDMADVLTSFSEPVQDFSAGEQAMTHLAGAGKEVGKALQIVNSAVSKLSTEFKEVLPGEEKFIAELVQLAALNPAAAIDKLNVKLNSLGKNLAGEDLKKAQTAIQGFIIEVMNGAAGLKSMGAAGADLQKIHDGLNKDTVSAKDLTVALTSVKGVLRSVESESAKLDLQNRLLKTRGEAVGVHTEIKSLINSMRAMGPEFRKSLSTGDARREFLSYANELGAKLETAMGPMRTFTGFKGVNEEIKKMTSSMGVLKSQSQGMVTLADRFTGKLRIAGDQFLNLVAYQTRWYVSQQIFFMGFGQLEKILSNFGALDKQVRRVLRVLRDSNNAVLGIDSSIRALAGAGTAWAQEWAKNMEVMFKAQTRTTFYNLFKQLGATSEEIGESMYQLGSAGLQANEVMSAIEPTLRMIIATEGEVKDTTRLIAGVFNLYGDSIEGARTSTEKFVYITDVLTATFRDHMVTIGELITGISYTIATAKLSGMQFEEVTAALATLNDNMLKGSKAGRAFNRMLLNSTKRLDETKDVLQAIGSQANIGVDLSKIFEGLEAKGARPFDYIIQAGIAMQEQLKTANLTVDNLTQTFKSMGVVGARAFAILLLKAGDYEKTLFQLKYAAFSAGEDMSELLIGGFDRSIHRIEGFTRAGYARLMGIARGGITVLASSVQGLESAIKKVSQLDFIPDIPDVKSYISFFGVVATGAAIMAGMKKKPLPGMDALKFDKWASGINKFTLGVDQNRNALRTLNIELKKTGINAISLGQAYENASNKMSTMGKVGSTISLFKGLRGSVENFKPQQQLIVSGLKDIERAFSKVTSGKWSVGDLDNFMAQMRTLKEFEPTFAARGQEFTVKTNLTRTISEFQKGSISVEQFGTRLNAVHKEIIRASGISKLTVDLDALDKEFASGAVTMDQYTAKLRKLGIEA
ncbi:MAG: phage tail tape measure protein, partial [Sulfurimonas sp.]|nr:phage tail tape measure protein [Sulfurimonas sp.]